MMSYNKYERGRQRQRITYKKNKKKILTLRLPQRNQWVGVDHTARIHSLNSPSMTEKKRK